MSGGGGGGETTQRTEPWDYLKPHLSRLYNEGERLYKTGAPSSAAMTPAQRLAALQKTTGGPRGAGYADWLSGMGMPGQSVVGGAQLGVVPFTALEQQAQQGLVDYANAGQSPLMGAASGELQSVLGGQYLDAGNPHLASMYQAASRPVIEDFNTEILPALTGQFAAAGRTGSGAHQNVATAAADDLTRNLAGMSANLYGQNYEAERNRMMGAAGMAPGMAGALRQQDLGNLGLLAQVGGAERDMASQMLGLPDAASQDQWRELMMLNDIYGTGSGFSTVSTPYYQNRMAGALGGAASGAGLGLMAGGPMGAGLGAGLGLLGGYFM